MTGGAARGLRSLLLLLLGFLGAPSARAVHDGGALESPTPTPDEPTPTPGPAPNPCVIPVPDHVDVGGGRGLLHVYIPDPAWALALAHASQRVEGLAQDDLDLRIRPSFLLATAIQESHLGCAHPAADPRHDTAWVHLPDARKLGCFQLARATAWKELGRLFPAEIEGGPHSYQDTISSEFGRDNFVPGAHSLAFYSVFAYAMTYRAVANPDEWFIAATDPRAREKVLALAWNRGAWSKELVQAMQGCPKGDIQRCLPSESVQRAHVVRVARLVDALEAGLADGACYREPLQRGDVARYVDDWARLRPHDDWTAVRDAALNAFDLAGEGRDPSPFQEVAPQVLAAIEQALDRPLRCPDEELADWYGFSCPP